MSKSQQQSHVVTPLNSSYLTLTACVCVGGLPFVWEHLYVCMSLCETRTHLCSHTCNPTYLWWLMLCLNLCVLSFVPLLHALFALSSVKVGCAFVYVCVSQQSTSFLFALLALSHSCDMLKQPRGRRTYSCWQLRRTRGRK